MIEKKFNGNSEKIFGYDVFISDCEEYAVANPSLSRTISGNIFKPIDLLASLEEKDYNYLFSLGGVLYFKKRENTK